ncbi:Ldh family oxidoreductase [Azospirillum endophyticum]
MNMMIRVPEAELEAGILAALRAAGAEEGCAAAATRAMMHASRCGVDSHGARLTAHYAAMLRSGRVNPAPRFDIRRTGDATVLLHADHGLGHAAAYTGMELACERARQCGIGAVGIVGSSHYGAAGAYALAGAEAGFIALCTTNSDAVVALHDGRTRFHGTNPIAAAAPVPNQKPWLLDMATSSIPLNRVLLYRTLGLALADGVAADGSGEPTTDPNATEMLMPLGGTGYGFKGAGLAGLVTLLSAVLVGGSLDSRCIPMTGTDDIATPRNIGHFCLAIDPARFVGREAYDALITQYLADLRGAPARPGKMILAPGDREWAVEAERRRDGIPIDPETAAFLKLRKPHVSDL